MIDLSIGYPDCVSVSLHESVNICPRMMLLPC